MRILTQSEMDEYLIFKAGIDENTKAAVREYLPIFLTNYKLSVEAGYILNELGGKNNSIISQLAHYVKKVPQDSKIQSYFVRENIMIHLFTSSMNMLVLHFYKLISKGKNDKKSSLMYFLPKLEGCKDIHNKFKSFLKDNKNLIDFIKSFRNTTVAHSDNEFFEFLGKFSKPPYNDFLLNMPKVLEDNIRFIYVDVCTKLCSKHPKIKKMGDEWNLLKSSVIPNNVLIDLRILERIYKERFNLLCDVSKMDLAILTEKKNNLREDILKLWET